MVGWSSSLFTPSYIYNLGLAFEQIVEEYPNQIALKTLKNTLTYQQLNQQVNQWARFLLRQDIQKDNVVAIAGYKTFEAYICMLACLKIGAIYTFFDPDSPLERLKKILSNCQPALIVSQKCLIDGESMTDVSVIEIDENLHQEIQSFEDINLAETSKLNGNHPAYIMYTSGSTGFPKGAVITHQNVLNLIQWSVSTYEFNAHDCLTGVNPLYFDNSVFDTYSALFSGASLALFTKEDVSQPKVLLELIEAFQCTSWFSVPTMLIYLQTMRALHQDNMTSIKRFIFGGEGYPKPKLKELFELYSHRAQLFNVYGPTECTCICSSYEILAENFDNMQGFSSLGTLIENFSYLILDEDNHAIEPGGVGELCLIGPNVGLGYYNDPIRTAKSFIANPLQQNFTEMMYKTGDMVCLNQDTQFIDIMGRKDHQIKHLGYRIELEEIETALTCLSEIEQAAVIHGLRRGLSQIIAIITVNQSCEMEDIKEGLKQLLPKYMLPTIFHITEQLPVNANGKIDRLKLKESFGRG